ncbi:hypothetical protein D3C73_1035740 [compost metagenome]
MIQLCYTWRIRRTRSVHARTQDNFSFTLIIRLIYGTSPRVILMLRQRTIKIGQKNAAMVRSGPLSTGSMKMIRFVEAVMAAPTMPGVLPIGGSSHFPSPALSEPASCLDMRHCPCLAVEASREAITIQV